MVDLRTYHQFLVFVLACKGGSLNYAARCVDGSVDEVSSELHRIEFLAGRRQFRIVDNQLQLTTDGDKLLARLKPVFDQLFAIHRELVMEN